MRFKVINLTRTPERLYSFRKNNPGLAFERFSAVDGLTLNRDEMVKDNLITGPCAKRYTPGALGVAMSHRKLWQECAASRENYTIIEDDAWLCKNFNVAASNIFNTQKTWDFVFWGANFDQQLIVELSPGVATATINYSFDDIKNNISSIGQQKLVPTIYRTWWTVGLVCYSIRPTTAEYLLDTIFPLKDYVEWRDNYGIDNSIIEELKNINAGVSLPPLALTLNDRYNSTVQVQDYGLKAKSTSFGQSGIDK